MKKLLWVGDANCPSGFARATHEILKTLSPLYDVTVLGINHNADPYSYPYPIYAAAVGGDAFGVARLLFMCDLVKSSVQVGTRRETVKSAFNCSGPDVICLQNDGWNIPFYVQKLARTEYKDVPIIAIVAVDGKNFDGPWLDGISLAIFWTQFALDEARAGGYEGKACVIPLGVDRQIYYPMDKREARKHRGIEILLDKFIVGNVNRNQPRKRWDLTVKYFAEWVYGRMSRELRTPANRVIDDAYLYLHTAPTGDVGVDVRKLAAYYGVIDRLALLIPNAFYGISEDEMRETYNCFDVDMSTTQGEGMGFTTLEAMACGVPCVVPDWSALGDWAKDAAELISCSSTCVGAPFVNVIGGVADEDQFIEALSELYAEKSLRQRLSKAGLARASEDRFDWAHIGQCYVDALDTLLNPKSAPVLEFARG